MWDAEEIIINIGQYVFAYARYWIGSSLGDPLITLEVLKFWSDIQVHKGFKLNF